MRCSRQGRSGFTLVEAMVVIAILSIMSAIMIPRMLRVRSAADLAVVLDQMKDVQSIATIHYAETAMTPTIEQIDAVYTRNGHDSLIGRYAVVPVAGQGGSAPMKLAEVGEDGYEPQRYVICSLMEISGYAYVYGLDDNPPMVAGLGADPVGSSVCGSGQSSNGSPASPPDDNGSPSAPPDDNGSPSAPPDDNGSPSTPPDDNGSPSAPPDDNGSPSAPPDDNGSPSAPPDDNGSPSTPPDDDGNGNGNPGNHADDDDDDDGHHGGGHDNDDDDDDDGHGHKGKDDEGDCDLDKSCPPDKKWKNHGDYASCIAHAKKQCEEKVNHGSKHKDDEGCQGGHH
ncbi:MAG: prepilin-type N-terminal cleavage/methylation domain-containing protein [Deltaproteobacteria bacterium]|nr:prepilin-type N-terminal cleavage/methylation domain-containing protein [Deltaproteobacteria bacterium]